MSGATRRRAIELNAQCMWRIMIGNKGMSQAYGYVEQKHRAIKNSRAGCRIHLHFFGGESVYVISNAINFCGAADAEGKQHRAAFVLKIAIDCATQSIFGFYIFHL